MKDFILIVRELFVGLAMLVALPIIVLALIAEFMVDGVINTIACARELMRRD